MFFEIPDDFVIDCIDKDLKEYHILNKITSDEVTLFPLLEKYNDFIFEREWFIKALKKHFPTSNTIKVFIDLIVSNHRPIYSNKQGNYFVVINPHEFYSLGINYYLIGTVDYIKAMKKQHNINIENEFILDHNNGSLIIKTGGCVYPINFDKLIMD